VAALDVADPEALGLDLAKLAALAERAERDVLEGKLPSCQLAVARHGRLGYLRSFGAATQGGVEAPATDETLYVIFSATKAVVSAATWLLRQDGALRWDERVAAIVPEFAENGKDAITVEQLLLHTAGFPHAPFAPLDWNDRAKRVARFARWRTEWEPGSRFEYHPSQTMWVLAELIERRTGADFRDFVRERVAEPLGLSELHLGLLAPSAHARVADIVHVGAAPSAEELAKLGVAVDPRNEVTEENVSRFNRRDVRDVGVPGGGGIANAASMALFYQGLLGTPPPGRVSPWKPETIEEALAVRTGDLVDPMIRRRANRGLGVVIAGDEQRVMRGFGRTNSPLAFGHMGAGGQVAWADPATGLSFAYLTNGHDRNPLAPGARGVGLSARAAACAGGA
jgi:CubicO group peptidase (beta-lactamase class C family)